MNLHAPAERSMNAGEYALGTLSADERLEFERVAANDAALRHEQYTWERRLATLALKLTPVAPRPVVWLGVLHATASQHAGPAGRATRLWAALATAASLVLAFGWYREATRPPPAPIVERVEVPVPAHAYVALLAVPQSTLRWSVSVVPARNELVVRADGAPPSGARDRDAELWLIADAGPVSLGVIPQSGEARLALPAGLPFAAGRTVAVSLEPVGGSPTGQPTGPVVTTATVLQAG